jgi:hypothetical protein
MVISQCGAKRQLIQALALILFVCSCANNETNQNNDERSWNLLGGSYLKTGEMLSWNGYWIEAYKDSVTQNCKVLLVHKGDNKTITDSLIIGTLSEDMVLDYGTLRVNDKWNPEIVAVFIDRDSMQSVVKAWRGNSGTGKFESIPALNISRGQTRE